MEKLEELMAEAFGVDNVTAVRRAISDHGCDALALRQALERPMTFGSPSKDESVDELRKLNEQLDEALANPSCATQTHSCRSAPHPPLRQAKHQARLVKKNAYRWVCDICGTENVIRDIVQSSRRASLLKAEDEALTCAECQFRPRTV